MENLKHGSRKVNIKVNRLVNDKGMKFHDIEGGFGEGKKSMLVKEIAYIHGTRVKIMKNKVAPPFKQAEFDIMYNEGISRTGNIVDVGVKENIVKRVVLGSLMVI